MNTSFFFKAQVILPSPANRKTWCLAPVKLTSDVAWIFQIFYNDTQLTRKVPGRDTLSVLSVCMFVCLLLLLFFNFVSLRFFKMFFRIPDISLAAIILDGLGPLQQL